MQAGFALRRWLAAARGRDAVERRQAAILQIILLVLIVVIALLALIVPITQGVAAVPRTLFALGLVEPLFIIPLWLLRSGFFPLAAAVTVGVFEFIVVASILAVGPTSPATGAAIAVPMTIAALVLRRPGLILVTVVSLVAVIAIPFLPGHESFTGSAVSGLVFTILLLGLVLDRFGVTARDALTGEIRHRREADEARVELERKAEELQAANSRLTREMTERALAEDARRAIEAKVLEVQKLESLGVLAGGIAHDFNNLLVAIMGNAGLALLDLPEDSPARQSIMDVEVASRRAGELARQMLAYSGRSRFLIEPVELSELIRELVALLQVSIGKGVVLKLDLPDDPVVVDADASQIRQVVMNLVINAADAIGTRSGTVTIRVSRLEASKGYLEDAHPGSDLGPGLYAALEVADTGVGMDAATQARIFDPFFTTKFTGRGLGLAAVLGIVRGHGGALRVYSELGLGTTFRVVLPLSASSPVPTEHVDGDWRGHGNVLVVDDDAMVRNVARRLLESFGLIVQVVDGGPQAIEHVGANPSGVDAVLLDMTMPEMSGPEVFERLRAIRDDLPVVLMSGYHEDEIATRVGAEISGFVQKPFTPADLARRMRSALEGHRPAVTDGSAAAASSPESPVETPITSGRDGV